MFTDVGPIIQKAVADERFSPVDEEQPFIRAEPIILDSLYHWRPSTSGSVHDFDEAIVAVQLDELQQLEIAGSGAPLVQ